MQTTCKQLNIFGEPPTVGIAAVQNRSRLKNKCKPNDMKQNIERPARHSSNTLVSRSQFKPILFSTDMVKAISYGTKTQTRRLMPEWCNDYGCVEIITDPELCDPKAAEWNEIKPKQCYCLYACFDKGEEHLKCKYDVGNILWVRETFTIIDWWENDKAVQVMYEDAKTAVKN